MVPWHRVESHDPIVIHYDPPADGSYPPRLLAPLGSIWISDNDALTIQNLFSLENEGNVLTLIPADEKAGLVWVNGQPLYSRHMLHDGDFVQYRGEPYIFQSDPVADRKRRMLALLEKQDLTVTPSSRLRQHIDLTVTGLSLDKRETYISWDEIVSLEFRFGEWWPLNMVSGQIAVRQLDAVKATKLHLIVTKQDVFDLIDWFRVVIPFDLSVFAPDDVYGGNIRTLLPDAYHAAAYEKILLPMEEGKRSLPVNRDVISGFAPIIRSGQFMLWGALGILALILLVGLATENDPVRNLALLLGVGLAVAFLFQRNSA